MEQPYQGRSAMANPYVNFGNGDRYDIFSIRAVIHRLGKTDEQEQIEAALLAFEQIAGDEDSPQASAAVN